ncbi:hypothetical protein ELS82_23885 [Vibrio ouci]|uniref:Uncharacterized protein n=1 Tax=Vibrio ouci TaxID=2499078 RepID=A0A4Y8W8L4_9VIBR|nr:hypothetical protein ELS82_23885 [Vibrio ouci]
MEYIEPIRIIILGLLGFYALIWAIPASIAGIVLSLGDVKRIIWIDKQLAKNADLLHANYQNTLPYSIISRLINYCLTYPFIRHRSTTSSLKFKVLMWANTLGFWCWFVVAIYAVIYRLL